MKIKPMSFVIVIDETNFFHPSFIRSLVEKLINRNAKILVGLVVKTKKTNSLEYYLFRNLYRLSLRELLIMTVKLAYYIFFKNILRYFKVFLSVEAVLKDLSIEYFYVENDVNKPLYIKKIKDFKPDIIISSCSVLFKKELLKIPRQGCINRHSSLLPSYGGVYPIFNAIADGKKYAGVTIHKMTERIDEGDILAQERVCFDKETLSEIYKRCFNISADLIITALENLKKNKVIVSKEEKSYFSFPNRERWIKFRRNGGQFF